MKMEEGVKSGGKFDDVVWVERLIGQMKCDLSQFEDKKELFRTLYE